MPQPPDPAPRRADAAAQPAGSQPPPRADLARPASALDAAGAPAGDYDLLVVGGGAAGFFGALAAAERCAAAGRPGLRVLILEQGARPLAKVAVSGGGRCNLTHACFDPLELSAHYPRGSRELRGAFHHFQPRHTLDWFQAHGLATKAEADGRVFPVSDSSQSVIDCLLDAARRLGIELALRSRAVALEQQPGGWRLSTADGQQYRGACVLLAAGGGAPAAYRLASGLGHTLLPPVPSLFSFTIPDPRLEGLAGVSVPRADLALLPDPPGAALPAGGSQPGKKPGGKALSASGALLVTHRGLSGPAVLRLSAWGARALADSGYHAALQVNWLPPHTPESLLPVLQAARQQAPRRLPASSDPSGALPLRLWQRLAAAGLPAERPWSELSNAALQRFAQELTRGRFQIAGKGPFKDEFVTCGGVRLAEVDFRSMESRLHPGLFFAGEILDIDGLTGGFNFQAAWTTGWLAGQAIAARMGE